MVYFYDLPCTETSALSLHLCNFGGSPDGLDNNVTIHQLINVTIISGPYIASV